MLRENDVFVGKDYCSLGLFMFEYEALNSHAFICHQVFLFFFVLVNSCNLGEGWRKNVRSPNPTSEMDKSFLEKVDVFFEFQIIFKNY